MHVSNAQRFLLPAVLALAAVQALPGAAPLRDSFHDDHRGTPRLLFNPAVQPEPVFSPGETAENYLRASADVFRFPPDLSTLRLERARESLLGRHFHFRQTLGGLPVLGGEIVVSVRFGDNRVFQVYNNTYPVAHPVAPPGALIGVEGALDASWEHLRVHGDLVAEPSADLCYLPEERGFRLVYRTFVATEAPFGSWEHRVDAVTGRVVGYRRVEIDGRDFPPSRADGLSRFEGPVVSRREQVERFRRRGAGRAVTVTPAAFPVSGTGRVFDPDPRSTLMAEPGELTSTSPPRAFRGAYAVRPLPDLQRDAFVFRLEGPWVRILDFQFPRIPPSTTGDGRWTAGRGDSAFNDVMVYYHLDRNHRYLRSLGYTDIQDGPIPADSNATESAYNPVTNRLTFGVLDAVAGAEDADVLLHEYWHAIQYDVNVSWEGGDTGAMGEGFADYWACSGGFSSPNGPVFHPDWVFHWDGHSADTWAGRALDKLYAEYDPAHEYPAHLTWNGVNGDELWGTPVWQSFRTLVSTLSRPREEMDTLVVQSNFGIGPAPRMPDMANALVATARLMFPDGPHAFVLYENFVRHGILTAPLNAGACTLSAEGCSPPNGEADPGETVTFDLEIRNTGASDTTSLVGTLEAAGNVTNPSGPGVYGTIPAGGSATRSFTFTVNPLLTCGDRITATLKLVDGAAAHPSLAWFIPSGEARTRAAQDFDGVTIPALPPGWTASTPVGRNAWATSTAAARSAPNSAFVADVEDYADARLDSPPYQVTAPGETFTFHHRYRFNPLMAAGGVLEISVNGGDFTDIEAAGGSFVEGGYSGKIPVSDPDNPLRGRRAWNDTLTGFRRVTVKLPDTAVGRSVVLRFRQGSTLLGGDPGSGWFIDDLRWQSAVECCGSAGAPGGEFR
ncbi:MAG: hypothetical protein KA419_17265 [Acidobacteria bacterium]|nr:hypothetical protein [Acidobacteriota bacterium]